MSAGRENARYDDATSRRFYSNPMMIFARPMDFGYKSGFLRNSKFQATGPQ
jgi:hypothetical protein